MEDGNGGGDGQKVGVLTLALEGDVRDVVRWLGKNEAGLVPGFPSRCVEDGSDRLRMPKNALRWVV